MPDSQELIREADVLNHFIEPEMVEDKCARCGLHVDDMESHTLTCGASSPATGPQGGADDAPLGKVAEELPEPVELKECFTVEEFMQMAKEACAAYALEEERGLCMCGIGGFTGGQAAHDQRAAG